MLFPVNCAAMIINQIYLKIFLIYKSIENVPCSELFLIEDIETLQNKYYVRHLNSSKTFPFLFIS